MTIVQDDTVKAARVGRTIDDRAGMLRNIAAGWDENIFRWDRRIVAGTAYGMTLNEVLDGLTFAAAEYAAPDMPFTEIRCYMEELRDATNALTRYETGNGWDGDDDPDRQGYSDETVLDLLNADIDWALWPLLSGMTRGNLCFRCSKALPNVAGWLPRLPGSPNCERHQ